MGRWKWQGQIGYIVKVRDDSEVDQNEKKRKRHLMWALHMSDLQMTIVLKSPNCHLERLKKLFDRSDLH